MVRRFLVLLAVSLLALGALSGQALAQGQPSIEVTTTITGASSGPCVGGFQTWTVTARVTVVNTSQVTATVTSVDLDVRFNTGGGGGQQLQSNVTLTTAGGLIPTVTIPAGGTSTFDIVATVVLPCTAVSAELCVKLTIADRDRTYQNCATFLSGGTPIPTGAIGALGIAALLGLGLLMVQRRRRQARAPATP